MHAPINVCCAYDDAMAIPALMVAASIQQSMRSGRRVVFYALATDRRAFEQSKAGEQLNAEFFEFQPLLMPESKVIQINLSGSLISSRASCARLSIPDILADVERMIYLDTDVVVNHPLDDLFDIDMRDHLICACPDYPLIKSLRHSHAVSTWKESVGLQSDPTLYFNTGVLLVDCAKWRRDRYSDKCEITAALRRPLFFGDQDLLNILCQSAYCKLDPRWNAFARYHDPRWKAFARYPADDPEDDPITLAVSDPWITHFAGMRKPWLFQDSTPAVKRFWNVVNFSPFRREALSLWRCSQRRRVLNLPIRKASEFLMTVSRHLDTSAKQLPPAASLSKKAWLLGSKLYRLSE